MIRLDTSSPSLIYSTSTHFDPGGIHRLIILIPADSDYTSAARRISDLAHIGGAHVLLLGLCKDAAQELRLRRDLVALSALLQDARVCAESKIEIGTNWVDVVQSNYQDGDLIVCFAEQHAGLLHRPLSQMLNANLRVPIYILSGFSAQDRTRSNWRSQTLVWIGSIGIILGMFILQIRITSLSQDWTQTTSLILSVIAEAWLIWVWNSLFG